MIYFDNAATNGFHPSAVTEAAATAVKYLSANPGRSGHRLSVAGAEIVYNARKEVARFFGVQYPERVIFTKNCTEALNTAIFGGIREGGHVITTRGEHNSVLRPLFFLAKEGKIRLDIVSAGDNAAEEIAKLLRPDTCMVVMNHVSNVTGAVQPVAETGALLRGSDTLFLVDAAQSAGHLPVDMKEMGIDLLAFAGHKGMYGIAGSGGLVLNEGADVHPAHHGRHGDGVAQSRTAPLLSRTPGERHAQPPRNRFARGGDKLRKRKPRGILRAADRIYTDDRERAVRTVRRHPLLQTEPRGDRGVQPAESPLRGGCGSAVRAV